MVMIGLRVLFTRLLPKTLAIALLLAALATLLSCSGRKPAGEEKKASPVAQSSPHLQPVPAVPPAPVRARVPSQGDCAPRYANGGKGTCINNQPCRGFGVRAENGSAVCTCFGRDGGCQEGQRCDPMRLACVPEKEPPFGRGNAD
jgi:hypothetical protein